jgi:hypothetical protein
MASSQAKTIRFSELVKTSGKPEVVTLWADPKTDKPFMDLVKRKRVVTLLQKPTGGKADFGLVGFHPQPFATFLVFPKTLKCEEGLRIVGIKYELLDLPISKKSFQPRILKAPEAAPKRPPEKAFKVRVLRTLSQELEFQVQALSLSEGKTKALAAADGQELPPDTKKVRDKIIEITKDD